MCWGAYWTGGRRGSVPVLNQVTTDVHLIGTLLDWCQLEHPLSFFNLY